MIFSRWKKYTPKAFNHLSLSFNPCSIPTAWQKSCDKNVHFHFFADIIKHWYYQDFKIFPFFRLLGLEFVSLKS